MTYLLQATTQPSGGFATWGASEWSMFGGVVVTVLSALTASIVAIIKATRGETKAEASVGAVKDLRTDVNSRMANVTNSVNAAQQTASQAMLHATPPAGNSGPHIDRPKGT